MRFALVIGTTALGSVFAEAADSVLSDGTYQMRNSADYDDTALRYLRGQSPKIVGGKPALVGEFPWQVSLAVSWIADPTQAHFCGGAIYNNKWIVTAAHCLAGISAADVNVVVGTNFLLPGVARVNAARLIVHKNYAAATSDHDIGLVELMTPLPLGTTMQQIALLGPSDETSILIKDKVLTITGWGATTEGGSSVKDLRKVDVPYVSQTICNDPLSYNGRVTANMICAGIAVGGKDSCQGDSGGPVVYRTVGVAPKLVGIVSWGEGCAHPGKYGVYTRVTRYQSWVGDCVSNPTSCQ